MRPNSPRCVPGGSSMKSRGKCRYRAWLITATMLCLIQTACNKSGPPAPPDPPTGASGHVGRCTLTGNFREANENAIAVHEFHGATLCLVADGMGGEAGLGRTASDRAVEALARELKSTLPDTTTADEHKRLIRRAIVAANADMMVAAADPGRRNMGATVALALWRPGDAVYVAGVGDTRAYLVRGARIEQLTEDHTLALALAEAKTITPKEAKTHRFKNVLWKYLGSKEVGEGPEVRSVPVQPGDRVLLCTKGVYGAVPEDQIRNCAHQYTDAQSCADALCQRALDSGSRDNVSCIVVESAQGK
jgi:PPM family protein phosphatase